MVVFTYWITPQAGTETCEMFGGAMQQPRTFSSTAKAVEFAQRESADHACTVRTKVDEDLWKIVYTTADVMQRSRNYADSLY